MQEKNISFEEVLIPFDESGNWQKFRSFSPTGRVPCLQDGQITVWDSLAILEYLAEKISDAWPQDPQARAWARCASAEMHSGFFELRNVCTMNVGIRVQIGRAHV